jgi:glycosyltransferase involved in cell wall biosynthesis
MCGAKVVWGLRNAGMDLSRYNWMSTFSFRLSALLSPLVDLLIANSQAGVRYHVAQGFCSKRMIAISNGIDTERFCPDVESGLKLRQQWEIHSGEKLIGLVGRLDPMKGHPTFVRAAALLVEIQSGARFVFVGAGDIAYRTQIEALVDELGLQTRVVWAGACQDMPAAYNALDIATSASSFGEGFSNAIAEAIACGVPCVATEVGDSAIVVDNPDQVVPPNDPKALSEAWLRILHRSAEEQTFLSRQARRRLVEEFGVARLVEKTEAQLLRLLPHCEA